MRARFASLIGITLVSVWVMGCAAPGRTYDDRKVAMINRQSTTEADLLRWFGPANARKMGPDGSQFLSWRFERQSPRTGASPSLQVELDPDGRVRTYTASDGTR